MVCRATEELTKRTSYSLVGSVVAFHSTKQQAAIFLRLQDGVYFQIRFKPKMYPEIHR